MSHQGFPVFLHICLEEWVRSCSLLSSQRQHLICSVLWWTPSPAIPVPMFPRIASIGHRTVSGTPKYTGMSFVQTSDLTSWSGLAWKRMPLIVLLFPLSRGSKRGICILLPTACVHWKSLFSIFRESWASAGYQELLAERALMLNVAFYHESLNKSRGRLFPYKGFKKASN